VLTINGLTAADSVLIPLQCEALSHRGVGQLLETIEDVRTFANEDLSVFGVIATMYDGRTRHARMVREEVSSRYGLRLLEPPVPKSVRFAEAPELGRSILQHAPGSRVRPPTAPRRPIAGRAGCGRPRRGRSPGARGCRWCVSPGRASAGSGRWTGPPPQTARP